MQTQPICGSSVNWFCLTQRSTLPTPKRQNRSIKTPPNCSKVHLWGKCRKRLPFWPCHLLGHVPWWGSAWLTNCASWHLLCGVQHHQGEKSTSHKTPCYFQPQLSSIGESESWGFWKKCCHFTVMQSYNTFTLIYARNRRSARESVPPWLLWQTLIWLGKQLVMSMWVYLEAPAGRVSYLHLRLEPSVRP